MGKKNKTAGLQNGGAAVKAPGTAAAASIAKKPSSTNAATTSSNAGKQTAAAADKGKGKATASEIDDIFSGKKKTAPIASTNVAASTTAASSATTATAATANAGAATESSKKRKRKRKAGDGEVDTLDTSSAMDGKADKATAVAPVTVVDTSSMAGIASQPGTKKQRTSATTSKTGSKESTTTASMSAAQAAKNAEEDELFRDSRGTSARRKTDDGLPIYDIKELNIGLGGDTPLCPFDCECCF